MGRWARIPREERLCNCGLNEIQDEIHILTSCAHTAEIRLRYAYISFSTVLSQASTDRGFAYIFEVLKYFEH